MTHQHWPLLDLRLTTGDLVLALYVDLKPSLRPAAERSVTAHLHKLRDDGVAVERDGVWVRK